MSWKTFDVSRYYGKLTSLESLKTSFWLQTSLWGILGVETLCSSTAVPMMLEHPPWFWTFCMSLCPQKDCHSCLILTTSVSPGSIEKPTKPLLQGGLRRNSPSPLIPLKEKLHNTGNAMQFVVLVAWIWDWASFPNCLTGSTCAFSVQLVVGVCGG